MKFPFVISAVAVSATLVLAQEPAAAPQVSIPQGDQPAETSEGNVQNVEQPVEPQSASVQSGADSETPVDNATATDSTVSEADVVAENIPDSIATTDSASIQAQAQTASTQEKLPADSMQAEGSQAAVANPSIFVPDTVTPPSKLLSGSKLGGSIHGFLKAEQSPYVVENDLIVEPNSVLVIEPGVTLLFAPNTGLNVQGQLVVAGIRSSNVTFKSASSTPSNGDWKGILLTGDTKSEIRHALISGATNGIILENSKLSLQSSIIEKSTGRGIFVRNSQLTMSDCSIFDNEGVGLHLANHSISEVQQTRFVNNKVALLNSELAQADIISAHFEDNSYGIIDKRNSYLNFKNTKVSNNKVGAVSDEVLDPAVLSSITGNTKDFESNTASVISTLPADPEIPGVQVRRAEPNESISGLIAARNQADSDSDTSARAWSIVGNVMLGGNYHYVQTRKNHSKTPEIIAEDTIGYKKHYKNTFQVPGFGAEASAYLMMTSPDGKTLEFSTDLTADSWNHFSPNPVTLTYHDSRNHLILGDNQKIGGDIYMSSMPLFGIDYTLSLAKNKADQPLLQFNAFGGENRKPYLLGDRHPYLYNDYIDDGEAQAQRMVYGGTVKWAPVRRFDATIGALYSHDEIEDPVLRDGGSGSTITSEPMQKSLTVFADGNWLFYPGDIELKGMIAVGRADTAQVWAERAINKVFSEAGLNVNSYAKLRQLMQHENRILSLSNSELQEIFGETSTLNPSEMRKTLQELIRKAKKERDNLKDDVDEDRVAGLNWGSQNFAIGATLNWKIYKTLISGHIKYVGEDFYSVGSSDQRADTREFGGTLEQIITNFWTLNFSYDLNVENAANGSKTNLLGLGEGTRWGLFPDKDSHWFDEHELDKDRTKYIQAFNLANSFKIGPMVDVKAGYNLEYRTQNRPTQLHGVYFLEEGIYKDKWFRPRKGKATTTIEYDGEEYEVDEERWSQYTATSNDEYLASELNEKSLKHTWNLGVSVKALKSIFKVEGRWTLRSDLSEFEKDSIAKKFDFADTTWSKLGYYYGGADYFDHAYPVSVTTTLSILQNRFVVTPRFKSYTRDNMKEAEITIEDEFEIPFMNRFLILGTNAQFRYLNTTWDDEDGDVDEDEIDVLGDVNLKVNHTKRLSSEWYTGAALYYRPDNRSNEYKDIYGGVRVNYIF